MNSSGITFYPLYWIYHDNWINRTWGWSYYYGWRSSNQSRHMGHLHFFMPGYPIKDSSITGQAFSGKQAYEFSLKSIWGPDSGDPNQTNDVKIIGSPKWYFEITEYWRRVYIQPWEDKSENDKIKGIVGRTGVKYDASHENHTYGPYREGQGFFFYWNKSARTLPIEYYLDEDKHTRNNFLYSPEAWHLPININYDESNSSAEQTYMRHEFIPHKTPFYIPNGDNDSGYVDRPLSYRINRNTSDYDVSEDMYKRWSNIALEIGASYKKEGEHNTIKYCDYGYHEYSNSSSGSDSNSCKTPFGAFNVSCADHRYIYPIIEYQAVKHLNWERLPGYAQRDRDNGGDGFDVKVELPYCVNDKPQSPFSEDDKVVLPMGAYAHSFDAKNQNLIPRFPYCDKTDIGYYQWVIVTSEESEDGFSQIETFSRIIKSKVQPGTEREGSEPLNSGERVAKNEPWPKGYVQDSKGRPVWAKVEDITTEEYRIPDNWKDSVMTFNVPTGMKSDGIWVEQCFGGVVRAKAVVTIKDNFGKVSDVEVSSTKFYLAEQFEGSDQNAPAQTN